MNTVPRQLVTIISESVVEQKLIADIKSCGAKGYSVGHVHGEGVTGKHSLDLNGPSIRLETIVTETVAQVILDMLSAKYFNKYATIAWITPAQVTRPERF
jgi:nitrogen regulatory protein P-II 2